METPKDSQDRAILERIAHQAMLDRELLPDFSPADLAELNALQPATAPAGARDLRSLMWCSIDNDDSLDLDQLTAAEALPNGRIKVLVAIADVDALVGRGSQLDVHAAHNTTSVYTPALIFPMLPEQLSTDLTSLNLDADRLAVVVEMTVAPDGTLQGSDLYRALVCNHAKLAYDSVAAWLEGTGPRPEALGAVAGLDENLRRQDKAAQSLAALRSANGALSLQTIEAKPVFSGDQISTLAVETDNRAKELIANFMIAANGVTARYLADKNFPSIRRVVRVPKRWERIVELAGEHNFQLPSAPDSLALEKFLVKERTAEPVTFPDLSLSVVKLLGAGEYAADLPGDEPPGHFGLAVRDYAHSTAPNRRYTDLITQRLLKAALAGQKCPYSLDELTALAAACTLNEDNANKVERQVEKSAAALLLRERIGEQFDAIVTGASPKGTWVRLLSLPVEGRLVQGYEGLDVGGRVRVQLTLADVEKGFIDFKRVGAGQK